MVISIVAKIRYNFIYRCYCTFYVAFANLSPPVTSPERLMKAEKAEWTGLSLIDDLQQSYDGCNKH